MGKYRKKPVVIEAAQWKGDNFKEVEELLNKSSRGWERNAELIIIDTLEGKHNCQINDWVILGVNSETYPCKPDIFEKTYEEVSADSSHD